MFLVELGFSWEMVGPEYQDMDCPKCFRHRVYVDRQIGFYCMACGHELTAQETLMLIEKRTLTSRPGPTSEPPPKKPIAEIKELPARRTTGKEHARRQISERQNPEQ
jgi:hypothetical protein